MTNNEDIEKAKEPKKPRLQGDSLGATIGKAVVFAGTAFALGKLLKHIWPDKPQPTYLVIPEETPSKTALVEA